MRSFGFHVINNPVVPKNEESIRNNLISGDTFLYYSGDNCLSFDEKCGTFISQSSWRCYKGNFYILTPRGDLTEEGIRNAIVIKASTIRSYAESMPQKLIFPGPSGSLGHRFKNVKNSMTLEQFMNLLVKLLLVCKDAKEVRDRLRRQFNKVLPKNAPKDNMSKQMLAEDYV